MEKLDVILYADGNRLEATNKFVAVPRIGDCIEATHYRPGVGGYVLMLVVNGVVWGGAGKPYVKLLCRSTMEKRL